MSNWQAVLLEPARIMLSQISQFFVRVLGVLVILIAGWLISKFIRSAVTKVLKTIKIDELSSRIELDAMLKKGGITYSLSELLGVICYWLGILITFMISFNAIGLTVAASLLDKIILYVPNVIAAMFILILGMFVATLLKNIVLTASNNAGISQSKFLSKVVEIIVTLFAIVVALEQLQIGIRITELTVGILLGSLGLGLALAFGLGCKDIAGRLVSEFIEKLKKQ